MKLSIVTTLYKSAPHVREFHRRASEAARKITDDYEIIMVDDGSPDELLAIACELVETDPKLRVVELSRNFGHHKALMAGLDHAMGELCFLIDSDLEEDPALLTEFHRKLTETESDVVYGYEQERKGRLVDGRGGRLAWLLIGRLYSVPIPANQCTARLMRREYVDALLLHRESNTIIGGLWVITGFRQIGVPIGKGRRGQPSYDFVRRVSTLVNGITSFSAAPLHLMTYVGMAVSTLAFVAGIVVTIRKFLYDVPAGWASLIVSLWFIGGLIVFCLGIIGTYISRIFIETKNRPYVIVRRIYESRKS